MPRGTHPNSRANLRKGGKKGKKSLVKASLRDFLGNFVADNQEVFLKKAQNLTDKDFCAMYLEISRLLLPKVMLDVNDAEQVTFEIIDATLEVSDENTSE